VVIFSRVRAGEASAAYEWFEQFAQRSDAIYFRDANWFKAIAEEGAVWWAKSEEGAIFGLVYTYFDQSERAWELGGLMVPPEASGMGIGSTLMRIALAHTLFENDPLEAGRGIRVVTHVRKGNDDPRGIIEKMHFHRTREIREPAERLPGLKAEADGFVYGDEFELELPAGLRSLGDWAYRWRGELKDGSGATIVIRRDGVDTMTWGRALREMASRIDGGGSRQK
jgi:GNAT superfamily N-acetyltransferase